MSLHYGWPDPFKYCTIEFIIFIITVKMYLTVIFCFQFVSMWTRFNENIIIDPGAVDVFPSSRIPKKLHHLVKRIYRPASITSMESLRTSNTIKEKGFRIPTDPHTLSSILQMTSDDEVTSSSFVFYM